MVNKNTLQQSWISKICRGMCFFQTDFFLKNIYIYIYLYDIYIYVLYIICNNMYIYIYSHIE